MRSAGGARAPELLIIGHGVLGRLLARIVIAAGGPPPVVWETNPMRAEGAMGYDVVDPRRRSSRSTARAASARASRSRTSAT
jgi:3-hydroxyethyl bacteriochlorophyllide a dehydrogenase